MMNKGNHEFRVGGREDLEAKASVHGVPDAFAEGLIFPLPPFEGPVAFQKSDAPDLFRIVWASPEMEEFRKAAQIVKRVWEEWMQEMQPIFAAVQQALLQFGKATQEAYDPDLARWEDEGGQ